MRLRRLDFLRDSQQELYRLEPVRRLSEQLNVSGSYTFFQGHHYGSHAEVPGLVEPEHHPYEDVTLSEQFYRCGLAQRFLGRPGQPVGEIKPRFQAEYGLQPQFDQKTGLAGIQLAPAAR